MTTEKHEIHHPPSFQTGVRVLMLRGRPKDGLPVNRIIQRVTYGPEDFQKTYAELLEKAVPGERIYGAASERSPKKAIPLFRERQLAAEYESAPLEFYKRLENAWVSALMAPTSQNTKLWMFDCDSEADYDLVMDNLRLWYWSDREPYVYDTKNGRHVIVQPFDKTKLMPAAHALLHDNPIMLWAY